MTNDEFFMVVKTGELSRQMAEEYLRIYVADMPWEDHMLTLWQQMSKRNKSLIDFRNVISATILLSSTNAAVTIDEYNPQNLLLKMPYYHQLGERDWFALLQEVVERDSLIELLRLRCWGLGIITPVKYDTIARQAFNWLYTRAEETGAVKPDNKDDIVERFTNLVMAYGGAAICNVFTRHESALKKVLNWRRAYFFERVLHEVYTIEELVKIKTKDLDRANPSLVKRLITGSTR